MTPIFTVKRGFHDKGEMAVVYYGDLELWIPWRLAIGLSQQLGKVARVCRKSERDMERLRAKNRRSRADGRLS